MFNNLIKSAVFFTAIIGGGVMNAVIAENANVKTFQNIYADRTKCIADMRGKSATDAVLESLQKYPDCFNEKLYMGGKWLFYDDNGGECVGSPHANKQHGLWVCKLANGTIADIMFKHGEVVKVTPWSGEGDATDEQIVDLMPAKIVGKYKAPPPFSWTVVARESGGKTFFKRIHSDGGSSEFEVVAIEESGEIRIVKKTGRSLGEYWKLHKKGGLGSYDNVGLIVMMKRR